MVRMEVTNLDQLHEWDAERIRFSLEGGNRILGSPLLKERFLSAKLTETQIEGVGPHLTNEEVYNRIAEADQLSPLDKKGVLDIQNVLYRKTWSKVVGWTQTDILTVYVNRKYFGEPKGIFSNNFHESLHQLGFLHQGRWATAIPYVGNRIAEDLWDVLCKDVDERYWKWWYS